MNTCYERLIKPFRLKNKRISDIFHVCKYAFQPLSVFIFLILIALSAIETYLGNYIGLQPSKLISYVCNKKNEEFGQCLLFYFLWMTAIAILISTKFWISDRLTIILRESLVDHLHDKYFKNNSFLDLLLYSSHIDNPDARIASDCTNWAQYLCSISIQLTMMPIYVIWYGIQTQQLFGFNAVLVCISFSVFSLFFSWLVLAPIVNTTYSFEAANGDYRLKNIIIKDDSESIALSKGQACEQQALDVKLAKALGYQKQLANYSIILNIITNIFNYFGNGLVYICIFLCQPDNLSDKEIAEFVSKVSFVTIQFIYGLTMIATIMQNVGKLGGFSSRLNELWITLSEHQSKINSVTIGDKIEMNDVTIASPNNTILLKHITLTVDHQSSLMITGPSGCGKSSILRTLGEIWPAFSGSLTLPSRNPKTFLILTQKPYIPYELSLYDCCAFPMTSDEVNRSDIVGALNILNLTHLIPRASYDSSDWQSGLSPGERQRIALARVIVNKPQYIILDEATSSISQTIEQKFYEAIIRYGIKYITVSHHQSLKRFHRFLLEIDESSNHRLIELNA